MLDFMDYIQLAFSQATGWNRDNSYTALTTTAQSLLDFHVPERLQVHLSSLSTPQFATTYTLGTVGLIDGSISYLFSTIPLGDTPSKSALVPLRKLVTGYQQIEAPATPLGNRLWNTTLDPLTYQQDDDHARRSATLLHAALHLPPPTTLTALFLRRLSPSTQLSLSLCSTQGPPIIQSAPQASLLAQLSHDTGKYSNEYLFSTDNALFGWRGLWNLSPNTKDDGSSPPQLSLISAGAEAYYSPMSSVVGLSTGLRFTTLPAATEGFSSPHHSSSSSSANHISTFPYTLTLTLTPLTGSLSTTYSLRASPNLAFSSRFGFNVYSWESEMVAGCELWQKTKRAVTPPPEDGLEWARRKTRLGGDPGGVTSSIPSMTVVNPMSRVPTSVESPNMLPALPEKEESEYVIKIRVDHSWNVRILWEGRVKELLVTAGVALGPGSFSALSSKSPSAPYVSSGQSTGGGLSGLKYWRGVGVSVLYSS